MKHLSLILFSLCTMTLAYAQVKDPKPKPKPVQIQKKKKTYQTKRYSSLHAKGHIRSHKLLQGMKHTVYMYADQPIPKAVDLSPRVSPPEDQGKCGACWAFSLTKALRSEYMLAGKDPGVLEFNYLLNNCGPGPHMAGCRGGDFIAAVSFEDGAGPGLNLQNPYYAKAGGHCEHLPIQATAVSYSMLGNNGTGPSFKDLAYAIGVEHHVLAIDVAAGQGDWENYSGGIYNDCAGTVNDVDHMINMVGYNCETSSNKKGECIFDDEGKPIHGDGYLIVMNNWGEDWGTQAANGKGGYMKIRMYGEHGEHCNAIAADALMFVINPEVPVVKKCKGYLCERVGCALPWCTH